MERSWLAVNRMLALLGRVLYRGRLGAALRDYLERDRELTHTQIALRRVGPGLDGLVIAFVSDVHAGHYMGEQELLRLFERVARQEPDLVCLGGDLVNLFREEVALISKAVSLLQPPLGTFAVPGNHEYDADPQLSLWRAALEEVGVEILINAGRRIERGGESLWIAGVDDLRNGEPLLRPALHGRSPEEPVLLLSHHPDFFEEARAAGVDLTLSGHTHGGQVLLRGRTPFRHTAYGYWSGVFERDGSTLFVSRGAGVSFLPLRIGARGEVPFLTLRSGP